MTFRLRANDNILLMFGKVESESFNDDTVTKAVLEVMSVFYLSNLLNAISGSITLATKNSFVRMTLLSVGLFYSSSAWSQQSTLSSFHEQGFIENRNTRSEVIEEKPYRVNFNGIRVDFTTEGLNYSVHGLHRRRIKDKYTERLTDGPSHETITYAESLPVLFLDAAPSLKIEALGLRKNYTIEHGKVQEKCFDKLVYREVWPSIDIVFSLPAKGGLKYDIILHPGADPDDIRLDYSAAEELKLIQGDLHVHSPLGHWVEHAPLSYLEAGEEVESKYFLEDGVLGFVLEKFDDSMPLVIDPWIELLPAITSYDDLPDPADSVWVGIVGTLVGTGLENAYNRVQMDYDAVGNIYVSQIPCLFYTADLGSDTYFAVGRFIHKYSPTGELLFTVDLGFEEVVCTDITVNKTTQDFYSEQQFSELVYHAADGTVTDIFDIEALPNGNIEICSIQYDHCEDKLLLGLGADFTETGRFIATTGSTFTGALDYSFAYDISLSFDGALPYNDNIDVLIDPYGGDYYMLFLLRTFTGFLEDRALLRADAVNVDPVWQVDGEFLYLVELAMHSVGVIQGNFGRNHYEALACSRTDVYGMNGGEILQWDKETGAQINQFDLAPSQQNTGRAEGIDIDMCGNVYIGGDNEIRVFDSELNALLGIPLTGMPQDIHIFGNKIYVAQDFNIQTLDIPDALSPWQAVQEPDSCGLCVGQASVTFCGQADAPEGITVEWLSNGETGFSTSGLCAGWNQFKVLETKGCYTNEYIDSVFVEEALSDFCSIQVNVDDQTICDGECAELTAEVSGQLVLPLTFTWSDGLGGNVPSVDICPDATGTYFVTVVDALGETTTDSVTVTVVAVPQVFLGNDTTLCPQEELLLDAGNIGAEFGWQDNSTGQTYLVTEAGLYWADVTQEGCTVRDSIAVNYNALSLDLGNDTVVCDLSGVLLDAGATATTYSWQDGSTLQFYQPMMADTFSVTVSNGACSLTDSISIAFSEISAFYEVTDTTLCDLEPIQFTDQSLSTTNTINGWSWDFGDGSTSSVQDPSHLYASVGAYSVSLTVIDIYGCEDGYTEEISVPTFPSPTAFFSLLPADPLSFDFIQFTDESIDAISWFWNLGDGTVSEEQNPNHSYEEAGDYMVQLVVHNEFCEDSISTVLRIGDELIIYVPNSFTPNNDGVNDFFRPVISGADVEEYEMLIYNRWGELVFTSTEIDRGWNGSYSGNTSSEALKYYVTDAIYTWRITVKENLSSEKQRFFGTLNVLR